MNKRIIKSMHFQWVIVVLAIFLVASIWLSCQKGTEEIVSPQSQTTEQARGSTFNMQLARDINAVMRVQDRHNRDILGIKGVVGTATVVGPQGGYAIKVMTEKAGLEGKIPLALDGVPVIVQVVGKIRPHDVYTGRYRPVQCGVSGHNIGLRPPGPNGVVCFMGTIGAVVEKNGKKYFLSNNHVFARSNRAAIGEEIVQPSPGDHEIVCAQDPNDVAAYLSEFKRIKWFPLRNSNTIDAAIAEIKSGVPFLCSMIGGYTPSNSPVVAELGMDVKKCGRTTGVTHGTVTGVNVTVIVDYSPDGYARFDDQVEFSDISDPGDSGSLIVTESGNNPVALLFAGSDVSTIGNPIQAVLDYFDVTICGE